jgi:hypothetical protein
MDDQTQCCRRLFTGFDFRRCGKKAKYNHEESWYCGTHYPPAEEDRTKRSLEKQRIEQLRKEIMEAVFVQTCFNSPAQVHKLACCSPSFKEGDAGVVEGWIEDAKAMAEDFEWIKKVRSEA